MFLIPGLFTLTSFLLSPAFTKSMLLVPDKKRGAGGYCLQSGMQQCEGSSGTKDLLRTRVEHSIQRDSSRQRGRVER